MKTLIIIALILAVPGMVVAGDYYRETGSLIISKVKPILEKTVVWANKPCIKPKNKTLVWWDWRIGFGFGDGTIVELGKRSDGVIVWRDLPECTEEK